MAENDETMALIRVKIQKIQTLRTLKANLEQRLVNLVQECDAKDAQIAAQDARIAALKAQLQPPPPPENSDDDDGGASNVDEEEEDTSNDEEVVEDDDDTRRKKPKCMKSTTYPKHFRSSHLPQAFHE
jgi:hypothetical protein